MNRKLLFVQYGILFCIIILPLLVVVGSLLATTYTALSQFFPTPSSVCTHVNCIFLLSASTVHQLFLISVYGIGSLVYCFFFIRYFKQVPSKSGKESLAVLGIACYCVYIQILRVTLSFFIFQHNPHWSVLLISQITTFAITLHAGMFFIHSFLITMKSEISTWVWVGCAVFISFCITYLTPLDSHLLTEQLIHKTGYFTQIRFFILIIYIITLINYTKNYIETRNNTNIWLQIGYAFQAFAIYALFLMDKSNALVTTATVGFVLGVIALSRYTALQSRMRK